LISHDKLRRRRRRRIDGTWIREDSVGLVGVGPANLS
jgi:hypothetical protein